jgi:imidazolonepropionase-like amidohydrolase
MRIPALLPFLLLAAPLAAQNGSVAVRAGKLITNDGRVIENGTVVVQDGRITAVGGPDLELPFDVLLREHPDAVLFPGFTVAHTQGRQGVDQSNENIPVAPFLDVKDSIDPVSVYYEEELRGGTVAIGVIPGNDCVFGGRGRVVAPYGMTVERMTLAEDMGVKVAIGPKGGWSRSAQLAELREAVDKLGHDLRKIGQGLVDAGARKEELKSVGEEEKERGDDGDARDSAGGAVRYGEDFPGKALISEEDLDEVQLGILRILNGEERVWLWCPEATDVARGLAWSREHGLLEQVVFVVTAPAWKAAGMLADAARPVVLLGGLWHVERDPVTWEETETFAPKAFFDAGVQVAVVTEEGRLGPDRPGYQAAVCLREGMPRDAALAAVTTAAAEAWGLGDRIGRIQEGYDGSFTLMSGDPLDAQSKVLEVWVRGESVYQRENDERLQRLLEGENQ